MHGLSTSICSYILMIIGNGGTICVLAMFFSVYIGHARVYVSLGLCTSGYVCVGSCVCILVC